MADIQGIGPASPSKAARALAGAAPSGPAPGLALAQDRATLSSARPVRVITFNTAVGNPAIKTPQNRFPDLPMYREIIDGSPDAPILAGQEIGPAQLDRLKALSKNGNFRVIATYAHPGQANMVLVPKRFEVVSYDHDTYTGSHLKGFFNAVKGWLFEDKGKPTWSQMMEPRKFTEVVLKDRESGRTFTLFNTHVSYFGPLKVEQTAVLFERARAARERGPVIVAGDLNTRSADNEAVDPYDSNARVRARFGSFKDMGPPATEVRPRSNIDWVLADGFSPVASKIYKGDALKLPGFPEAEVISDHYAEEDTLKFD